MEVDLIIRNGTVVDGTGAPSRRADVAIAGDRIVAVGEGIDAGGAAEIDAEGRLVTPGFVDVHTHLDAQLGWDPLPTSSCWHGITSVVLGSCPRPPRPTPSRWPARPPWPCGRWPGTATARLQPRRDAARP